MNREIGREVEVLDVEDGSPEIKHLYAFRGVRLTAIKCCCRFRFIPSDFDEINSLR